MSLQCPLCDSEIEVQRIVERENELSACSECFNPLLLSPQAGTVLATPLPKTPDIRVIAPEKSLGGRILSGLNSTIEKLPVLPEICKRVMTITNDPESSIEDLANLIAEDAVIAAKVLQVANSAMYGGLSEISDIKGACARLGMRTVANTVQTIASGNLYKSEDPKAMALMEKLWRHAVATAYLSGEIAYLVSEPRVDVLYLCGLMHDIGKVALLNIIAKKKTKDIAQLREKPELFAEVTERFHNLVGLHVVRSWKLPFEYAGAVYWHQNPDQVASKHLRQIAHIVALANAIAHQSGYPSDYELETSLLTHPSTSFFSLSDIKIATLRVDLEERMEVLLQASA